MVPVVLGGNKTMGCMEHRCPTCYWAVFDNEEGPIECPRCGGRVVHIHDEDGDLRAPRDYDYGEDDTSDPYEGAR
jgi:uncharacterized Zn finger protein (UPF0148 family)